MVLMNIDAFEKKEQMIKLSARVLEAEQQRLSGAGTLSIDEAREKLRERIDGLPG